MNSYSDLWSLPCLSVHLSILTTMITVVRPWAVSFWGAVPIYPLPIIQNTAACVFSISPIALISRVNECFLKGVVVPARYRMGTHGRVGKEGMMLESLK